MNVLDRLTAHGVGGRSCGSGAEKASAESIVGRRDSVSSGGVDGRAAARNLEVVAEAVAVIAAGGRRDLAIGGHAQADAKGVLVGHGHQISRCCRRVGHRQEAEAAIAAFLTPAHRVQLIGQVGRYLNTDY